MSNFWIDCRGTASFVMLKSRILNSWDTHVYLMSIFVLTGLIVEVLFLNCCVVIILV